MRSLLDRGASQRELARSGRLDPATMRSPLLTHKFLRRGKHLARSRRTERGHMTEHIHSLKAALQNKRSELARSIRSQSSQLSVCESEHDVTGSDAEHEQTR